LSVEAGFVAVEQCRQLALVLSMFNALSRRRLVRQASGFSAKGGGWMWRSFAHVQRSPGLKQQQCRQQSAPLAQPHE
jgi:hypothetical protein